MIFGWTTYYAQYVWATNETKTKNKKKANQMMCVLASSRARAREPGTLSRQMKYKPVVSLNSVARVFCLIRTNQPTDKMRKKNMKRINIFSFGASNGTHVSRVLWVFVKPLTFRRLCVCAWRSVSLAVIISTSSTDAIMYVLVNRLLI